MSGPQKKLDAAQRWWSKRPLGHKIAIATLSIFSIVAILFLTWLGNTEEMEPAFHALKPEASARIVKHLEDQRIPYEFEDDGRTLLVPVGMRDKVRIDVAGEKIIEGNEGFSFFKEPQFGIPEETRKILYRKAMQDELRQTLLSMEEIADARVHIVLPKKATFKEDDQEATASVALQLKEGGVLAPKRVEGIVNLIASAVEGLSTQKITIVDQKGNILSNPTDPQMAKTSTEMEFLDAKERKIQDQIQAILKPLVGEDNARVQVTVEADFSRVEEETLDYNPESKVERNSQERVTVENNPNQPAQGVPGVEENLRAPANGEAAAAQDDRVKETDRTVNYELSSTRRKIQRPVGGVTRMSIAVVVNTRAEADAAEGATPAAPAPRSAEELQRLEALISAAVGVNAERGDALVVSEMPFLRDPLLADLGAPQDDPAVTPDLWRGIRYGLILVMAILLLVFLVRPLIKAVTAPAPDLAEAARAEEANALGLPASALFEAGEGHEGAHLASLDAPTHRSLAVEFASQEPRKTAQILRAWLLEEGDQDGLPNPITEHQTRPREAARA
jgi:flagellar M-ring protein FliF